MTAYELRTHLRDAHGVDTSGLPYGQLHMLHATHHGDGLADHTHREEDDGPVPLRDPEA